MKMTIPKIEDSYRLTQDPSESLLAVMRRIPGGSNIDLELPTRESDSFESRIPNFEAEDNPEDADVSAGH